MEKHHRLTQYQQKAETGGSRGGVDWSTSINGASGTSYGNGGKGGGNASSGSNGWVYIEYGGDIK